MKRPSVEALAELFLKSFMNDEQGDLDQYDIDWFDEDEKVWITANWDALTPLFYDDTLLKICHEFITTLEANIENSPLLPN